jgi:hypothetical protein
MSVDRMENWSPSISLPEKPFGSFSQNWSRRNLTAFSKPDGSPNYEAAFLSNVYDDMLGGISTVHAVGAILSSPVISRQRCVHRKSGFDGRA